MTEVEEQTVFTFSELNDKAKEAARRDYRDAEGFLSYEWWDSVYEDAIRMATCLGISISTTRHTTHKGRPYETTDIHFSGFCSQGDGACFEGDYTYKPDAVDQITAEAPQDKELLRIATALTTMGIAQRLLGYEPLECRLTTNSRYSHSGSMGLEMRHEDFIDDAEEDLLKLMRDFADWIYEQLENEYDYLYSDEVVDQCLDDLTFDSNGSEV